MPCSLISNINPTQNKIRKEVCKEGHMKEDSSVCARLNSMNFELCYTCLCIPKAFIWHHQFLIGRKLQLPVSLIDPLSTWAYHPSPLTC